MKKICILLILLPICAFANTGDFDGDRWNRILTDIQSVAIEMNISPNIINSVIQPSVFIPEIINHDKNQSEFKLTLDDYLARTINTDRIKNGKIAAKQYPTLLKKVHKKYGVQPNVILAFWGLESNYGTYRARYKLTDAFLTLIYDGRRETFFKKQLLSLMKTADKNNLEIANISGSWAGAMGHFQFIPTTLEMYGVDGNGDGRVDIIHSVGDAMFSAGNYLSKLGWDSHEKIVRRVKLPADFDRDLLDGATKKSVSEWAQMGLTNPDGSPLPNAIKIAGLVADLNLENPEFGYLTYPNFYRIRRWNSSNFYAIAVATLADKLK